MNYIRERVILWWLSFFLLNLCFLAYLRARGEITRVFVPYFFYQESLRFLFLLSPKVAFRIRVLSLKGGFGPLFEWLPLVVNKLQGLSLLHFLRSIKLPYYPVFIRMGNNYTLFFMLGAIFSLILILRVGGRRGLLIVRRLEGRNILLILSKEGVEFTTLFLLYTLNFIVINSFFRNNPRESLERSFYFLSLPLNIRFRIKLFLFYRITEESVVYNLFRLILWMSFLGGLWRLKQTMSKRTRKIKNRWKWAGVAILRVILLSN